MLDQGVDPSTPPASHIVFYNKGGTLCSRNPAGTITCGLGGGGAPSLDQVTALAVSRSLSNGANTWTMSFALTTTLVGVTVSDTGASATATALKATSSAGIPFQALAGANGVHVDTTGKLVKDGTGGLDV